MTEALDPKAYQRHLEAWRLHRDMTQEQVADRLDVSHTTVGRWERGAMNITSKTLVDLCHLYEVLPQQLLAPPTEAARIARVAEIQEIVAGLNDEALGHLKFFAQKMK